MGPALLEALFTQTVVGLFVLDAELRIARARREEYLGRRFTEVFRFEDPEAMEKQLYGMLREGVPESTAPVRGRCAHGDGTAPGRVYAVSFEAFGDPPLGVLALVTDAQEQQRAQAQDRALAAVRERVGQSLDVGTTCQGLVDAVVPDFADVAVVDIVEDVLRGAPPPPGPPAPDTPLRRIAFRGTGGHDELAHPVGDVRRMPFPTPYASSLADLLPRLVPVHPDSPWLRADPDRARAITANAVHSMIVAPLALRGAALGLLTFYRVAGSDAYVEDDLAFAQSLAAHTALSIDNARNYERDHTIASTIQRRLLPTRSDSRIAVETVHTYLPGRNSGCWFDTIPLSGARTALVVGQVSGRGIGTATTMGQLRTAVRTLAALDLEPDELLARLSDTALHLARERAALPPEERMSAHELAATCLYGVYDPFTHTCTMARAGHSVPLVVHPGGRAEIVDIPEGPQLASADHSPFAKAELALEEGSVLTLFSSKDDPGSRSGMRPLLEVLATPHRKLQDLCDEIVYNFPAEAQSEGSALLLARTGSVPADRQANWELGDGLHTPAKARALVRERTSAWSLPPGTVEAAELVISELVTNAVRYGAPPISLRLIRTDTLTCEVHDSSEAAPHLRHARTVDEGGRGLFIVSQLATHWGTRYTQEGKTIWAELALPAGRRHGA